VTGDAGLSRTHVTRSKVGDRFGCATPVAGVAEQVLPAGLCVCCARGQARGSLLWLHAATWGAAVPTSTRPSPRVCQDAQESVLRGTDLLVTEVECTSCAAVRPRRTSATGFVHGHGPRPCTNRSATSSGRRAEHQQVQSCRATATSAASSPPSCLRGRARALIGCGRASWVHAGRPWPREALPSCVGAWVHVWHRRSLCACRG
jgi:hypothetical protein